MWIGAPSPFRAHWANSDWSAPTIIARPAEGVSVLGTSSSGWKVAPVASGNAHDRTVGAAVSFQEGSELLRELAGVEVGTSRWSVRRSSWERKSPRMKDSRRRLGGKSPCLPPSISDWMARDSHAPGGTAGRTGKPGGCSARTREVKFAPSGARNRGTPKACSAR